MIILVCIVLGMLLRLGCGRSIGELSLVKLRGEAVLLTMLALQTALPLVRIPGAVTRVVFACWLATFPIMILTALLNRRQPGMSLLAVGLLLNLVVIVTNMGMPVLGAAVTIANGTPIPGVVAPTDYVHVLANSATAVPWLADVLPMPAGSLLRSVASPGDVLLFSGIVGFLACAWPNGSRAVASRQRD